MVLLCLKILPRIVTLHVLRALQLKEIGPTYLLPSKLRDSLKVFLKNYTRRSYNSSKFANINHQVINQVITQFTISETKYEFKNIGYYET